MKIFSKKVCFNHSFFTSILISSDMIGNCLALVVWREDTDLSLTTIIASAVTTIIRRPNTPIKAMDITLSPLSI